MTSSENTLFMRLTGPMQSWGTGSRFQIRRTDSIPSKSGVIGMLLCAGGVSREASEEALRRFRTFKMGVRIDHPGLLDWDYHTAGAHIGIRSAEGKTKITASSGKPETLLSRRQYIYDASFLVALQGDPVLISESAISLQNPEWPVFLGRKCCIPTEPVLAGVGSHTSLSDALASVEWTQSSLEEYERPEGERRELEAWVEFQGDQSRSPTDKLVHDVPVRYGYNSHAARWIQRITVSVSVAQRQLPGNRKLRRNLNYTSPQWRAMRLERLRYDNFLCVFCKAPAEEVHHVDYTNAGNEDIKELRSLCKTCHDACTMLEYGMNMELRRMDPLDPEQRSLLLEQIQRLHRDAHLARRRALLETVRTSALWTNSD